MALKWDKKLCKNCNICLEICPKKGLVFKDGELVFEGECIKCMMCEKYCPDMGIKIEDD